MNEKDKPLTREDLLERIKSNKNSTDKLDLSESYFEEGIDLRGLKLNGINLTNCYLYRAHFDGASLFCANLQGCNLGYATFDKLDGQITNLEGADMGSAILDFASFQEANLTCAQFQGPPDKNFAAYLKNTDFRKANLFRANFKNCYFYGTQLEGTLISGADIEEGHLGDADWGNYRIGEEIEAESDKTKNYLFKIAEQTYRQLKMLYQDLGYYDVAAEFYYREKEANRKSIKLLSKHWNDRLASEFFHVLFGYGERWANVLIWIIGLILFFSVIYSAQPNMSFTGSLYYSAVSFIALGYGGWVIEPQGWARLLGVFETFLGFIMMTLLLTTFIRKWTR